MGLIWTIGYQRLAPGRLLELTQDLDALVVDTRAVPKTRVRGYGPVQLRDLLGDRYTWAGDMLGGRGHVTEAGITWLKRQRGNLLLMCVCHEPGVCHRHNDICAQHFPEALHIYENEVIEAGELSRAIRLNDDYACFDLAESVAEDVIRRSNSSPD
jgi:hypothetical protein